MLMTRLLTSVFTHQCSINLHFDLQQDCKVHKRRSHGVSILRNMEYNNGCCQNSHYLGSHYGVAEVTEVEQGLMMIVGIL